MRRPVRLALILLTLGATPVAAAEDTPLLAAVFSDHAVLQRGRPIPVWGRAAPGETVQVSLGDATVSAMADGDGRWRAELPAQPAGGPVALTARAGGGAETASDILIGDVWLCSGQSNMELQVSRVLNAPTEMAASADDGIRLLTIVKDHATTPQTEFRHPLAWKAAAPATVGDFSAACYFFARELRREHDVPMGLINSSWGGSAIQAWMSAPSLRAQGYGPELDNLDLLASSPAEAQARWGRTWQEWWSARAGDAPWSDPMREGWRPVPSMTPWETWGVPELAAYNGMIWYRTEVDLTAAQAGQRASLSLGNVDEADQTWVNGRPLGASGSGERLYPLPEGVLRPGRNTVVINVLDSWAVGGLYGPPEKRALIFDDGSSAPLDAGGWRYRMATVTDSPPRAPWSSTSGKSTLSNAMIEPLDGYGLSGAVWYQGETNTNEGARYRELLAGLMADWRERFRPELPFLVVQLANFGPPPVTPGVSGWAELRESQRLAVAADDHAGLAVAIDLGDRWDIHPGQKLELGRRLARAGRHVVYGEEIAPSGPEVREARRQADEVVVTFDHVTGRLTTYSGDPALGFELCGPEGANCRYAEARPDGSVVRIAIPAGAAAAEVRYAWADNPTVNLFDETGLPAGPFRIPVR